MLAGLRLSSVCPESNKTCLPSPDWAVCISANKDHLRPSPAYTQEMALHPAGTDMPHTNFTGEAGGWRGEPRAGRAAGRHVALLRGALAARAARCAGMRESFWNFLQLESAAGRGSGLSARLGKGRLAARP